MIRDKKIGLAFSGGGFRAAAFHLGTLTKLNELGLLNNIDVLSTISGGSIVGAYYVLNQINFNVFRKDFQNILRKNLIIRACLSFNFLIRVFSLLATVCLFQYFVKNYIWTIVYSLALIIITGCYFYIIFPTTKLIQDLYDSLIFKGKILLDLPDQPKLVINSTNLDTGTLFSFTKEHSFDFSYMYPPYNTNAIFETKDFPIAVAVLTPLQSHMFSLRPFFTFQREI
jgi:NTE family protein